MAGIQQEICTFTAESIYFRGVPAKKFIFNLKIKKTCRLEFYQIVNL